MKTLNEYINEAEKQVRLASGEIVKYDKSKTRRADSLEYYKIISNRYLEELGGQSNFKQLINETINTVNSILSKISSLTVEGCDNINFCEFLNGQALGRIFENILADKINKYTPAGFIYKQGTEASFDKDIDCVSIPTNFNLLNDVEDKELIEYLKYHWSGKGKSDKEFFKSPKYFGIELKTSQSSGATGNKTYAASEHDENSKSKSAFYIIINYKKPSGPSYSITGVKAYFGFLDQMDWSFYADKTGTATINKNILKTRFIQIF